MKLLLVDDHDLLRNSLKSFVEADGTISVDAVANLEEGLDAIKS